MPWHKAMACAKVFCMSALVLLMGMPAVNKVWATKIVTCTRREDLTFDLKHPA